MSWRPFDEYAVEYDLWYQKHKEILESERKLVESLDLKGLGIEVGVGSGIFVQSSRASIGIDPAKNMLKIAKKRGIEVICAVGEFLPFRDKTFDFVVMVVTLCFLENPKKVLKEAWRIMKDEGEIAICIVPRNSKWGEFYEKKKSEGHRFYKFARFYTFEEAKNLLKEEKFEIMMVKSTLRQAPRETFLVEEPESGFQGHGFICIKAVKSLGTHASLT